MQAETKHLSPMTNAQNLHTLLDFYRIALRVDDQRLQQAIRQYEQALAEELRGLAA